MHAVLSCPHKNRLVLKHPNSISAMEEVIHDLLEAKFTDSHCFLAIAYVYYIYIYYICPFVYWSKAIYAENMHAVLLCPHENRFASKTSKVDLSERGSDSLS